MQKNAVIITIISLIACFAFLFLVYSVSNKPTESAQSYPEAAKLSETDHSKWSSKKKTLLVEYGDLQCPACRSFHAILKQIESSPQDADIAKNITFVYRHFPLTGHKNAYPAAQAAEAAGAQGKFFQYVDFLYENQDAWSELPNPKDFFIQGAKGLKLNTEQFTKDMDSLKAKGKIDTDSAQGSRVTVNSTPTFFLNGKKIEPETVDEFKALLKNAIK